MSAEDRRMIDDFRAVDRVEVAAVATTVDQYDRHLTDYWDAARRVHRAATAWRVMSGGIGKLRDRELDELVHRYLEERGQAWAALERSLAFDDVDEATLRDQYRTYDEAATATSASIDAALAKLDIAAPAPPAPDAGVVLQAPPTAPPGSAFFLAGDTAVALDARGFHVIAHDVDELHVAENGIAWACASWRAVKWDGTSATEVRPKLYNQQCGAGADGTLWVGNSVGEDGKDKLASFDGKRWKVITAPLGVGWRGAEQIVGARDGNLYARAERGKLVVLDNGAWRDVPYDRQYSIEHIFRAADGNVWMIHQTSSGPHDFPDALSKVTPEGVDKPVFVDDHFQTSQLWGAVDAAGVATIFDARRNVIVQGNQTLRLPLPNTHAYWYAHPGGFAYDAAGRLWVDLVDGLHVIDPDGTHHVFPIGSVDAIRRPLHQIHVVGAGPPLPTPRIAETRTIHGTLKVAPNMDILACVVGTGAPPCGKGVKTWTASTDAEGRFTLEGVPRYRLELQAHTGLRGHKRWRSLTGTCCDGDETDVVFGLAPDPQY